MDIKDIIDQIDAFARETGLAPSTICAHATKNARLYDALKRQDAKNQKYAEKLSAYMAKRGAKG